MGDEIQAEQKKLFDDAEKVCLSGNVTKYEVLCVRMLHSSSKKKPTHLQDYLMQFTKATKAAPENTFRAKLFKQISQSIDK